MSDIGNSSGLSGQGRPIGERAGEAAASMRSGAEALQAKAQEGLETLQDKVEDVSERAGQYYNRGNVAVTRSVDPLPSLAIAAAVGFMAGYLFNSGRN